jgi:orotate phosphoribosyltransferase
MALQRSRRPRAGWAPLVGGMLVAHARQYYGQGLLRGFLVRKAPKDENRAWAVDPGELIEGALCRGDNVLILEDVVTTGRQTKRACEVVEAFGAKVRGVIAVVDRQAVAAELLAPYNFRAMMTATDLGV